MEVFIRYQDCGSATYETVVLLSKGEVDSKKIRVEFSLEDMDMSEFQDGATYTQIKDYLIYNDPIGYAGLVLNGNPETYLKTVTEYKPVDFQPSAFSLAEGRFLLNSF